MSSNEDITPGNSTEETTKDQTATEIVKEVVPNENAPTGRSPSSNSSGSNAESLSAYAERTVATIVQRDNESSGPVPNSAVQIEAGPNNVLSQKESVSDLMEISTPLTIDAVEEINSGGEDLEGTPGHFAQDPYSTDTSEFGELLDGSGVSGPTLQGANNIFVTLPSPSSGDDAETKRGNSSSDDLLDEPPSTSKATTTTRQLSITGRAALRKCFTENRPINIPVSQPVIALSEGQMHTVLRTISDESLLSSFHLMKSLLLQAADGKVFSKERCRHVRRAGTPGPGQQSSSEGESSGEDCAGGSYTSGAINSDDALDSLDFHIEHNYSPTSPGFRPQSQPTRTATPMLPTSPGSGYSAEDYAPLATLFPKSTGNKTPTKPARKRQRVTGRPGKVMKESYFKGIKWTKTFVTGPLDPAHNQHKFYCQICKTNVSIKTKGAREIVRHYQGEAHLRKDQRWRFEQLSVTDKVTGITRHQVRGKDGRILTPLELEREKLLFENAPLVDVGERYPFYDEYLANSEGQQTTEDQRASIQIALIGNFVPYDGNISLLQTLWSQVGEYMNHKEQFSPFDWSSATMTVSLFPLMVEMRFCLFHS